MDDRIQRHLITVDSTYAFTLKEYSSSTWDHQFYSDWLQTTYAWQTTFQMKSLAIVLVHMVQGGLKKEKQKTSDQLRVPQQSPTDLIEGLL